MPETNITSGHQDSELFRGREGKNNERILLVLSQKALPIYQIKDELGRITERKIKYSTVFDRVKALEQQGVVKVVGETIAKRSHQPIAVYGLGARGVYASIFGSTNDRLRGHGLNICSRMFAKQWETFSKIYEFNPKQRDLIKKWVSSNDGVTFILHQFGYSFLDREIDILLTFRRMIDLSIFLSEWQFTSTLLMLSHPGGRKVVVKSAKTSSKIESSEEAMMALATLAYHHEKLRKLYDAIKDSDGPLLEEIERKAKDSDRLSGIRDRTEDA